MANFSHSLIIFLIILNVVATSAARDIPDAKKQPQNFIDQDGSVLIPGVGRWMFPSPSTHYDPITYNPITGTNGGNGVTIPGFGGVPSYVPGGDDTLVPNPGVEVPAAGGVPVPSSP